MAVPVEWIPYDGKIPLNAVAGGVEDGVALYIARGTYKEDLLKGKLHSRSGILYVPWGGKSNALMSCKVLVAPAGNKLRWQTSSNGIVEDKAVVGGETDTGEKLYIGRVHLFGNIVIGKIHPRHQVCYIAYSDKELGFRNYEILCELL